MSRDDAAAKTLEEMIFGKKADTISQSAHNAACESAYRRGILRGFEIAKDHIQRMLLMNGDSAGADKVKAIKLGKR